MTPKDSKLRKQIRRELPRMPADMAGRFDDTVASFHRRPAGRRTAVRVLRFAVLILLAVFLLLPNLSPTIAYAMQEIPVIGELVRVITICKKQEGDDNHAQNVKIPQIQLPEGSSNAIDYINADVDTLTKAAIDEYESTVEELPDAHLYLMIDYDVVTNTTDWFTLRLMVYREAGTSGIEYHFYHIDKQQGKLMQLADLFRPDYDYQTPISAEIQAQMRQQFRDNPNMCYWIDGNGMGTEEFERIADDQSFYFDDKGDLVIVFEKYDVAPGYMGCPEFVIPREVYQDGFLLSSTRLN